MQKTTDTLEDLENRLDGWITSIENKITDVNSQPDLASKSSSEILSKLNNTQAAIAKQVANFESSVKDMNLGMKDEANNQMEKIQSVFSEVISELLFLLLFNLIKKFYIYFS